MNSIAVKGYVQRKVINYYQNKDGETDMWFSSYFDERTR